MCHKLASICTSRYEDFYWQPSGRGKQVEIAVEYCGICHSGLSVAPQVKWLPMSKLNDAFEHLRAVKSRYRIVLQNDIR